MRNMMPVAHGNAAINLHVKIDIKIEAHFANEAFINLEDTRNGFSRFAHRFNDSAARRGIENIVQSRSEKPHADRRNNEANKNGGPIIGAAPLFTPNQSN